MIYEMLSTASGIPLTSNIDLLLICRLEPQDLEQVMTSMKFTCTAEPLGYYKSRGIMVVKLVCQQHSQMILELPAYDNDSHDCYVR